MKGLSILMFINVLLVFYLGESNAKDEIFATDVENVIWLPQPQVNDNCAQTRRRMLEKTSLYGFSLAFDDKKDTLFVGAPGCNGLYECKNFKNFRSCEDVSRRIYSSNNPGINSTLITINTALKNC